MPVFVLKKWTKNKTKQNCNLAIFNALVWDSGEEDPDAGRVKKIFLKTESAAIADR